MKRIFLAGCILVLSAIYSFAETGAGGQPGMPYGMMGEGMMTEGMMQMCQPMMMQQMMGQGMMMQNMMEMMTDMMNIEEKMMTGATKEEKKQMMEKMAVMRQKMMTMRMAMMGMTSEDAQRRFQCVEAWLKKAIDLHEIHIKDPKTATEASQMEMMEQMKNAYDCLKGPMIKPEGKKQGKDPHGH